MMQNIIVVTGFCEPGAVDELYRGSNVGNVQWQLIDGNKLYRQLIKAYWSKGATPRKCILMAAEQLVMAWTWQALQDSMSVLIDFSWLEKCRTLLTDIEQVKKKYGIEPVWIQGIFRDMEQYEQGMRTYSKTEEYRYLYARVIKNGCIWAFRQSLEYRALYYDKIPCIGIDVLGGVQKNEAEKLCRKLSEDYLHGYGTKKEGFQCL